MLDIDNHYEEQFAKFDKEVREVLKPFKSPILLETSITYAIGKIHMEHVKEETNYIFNSVKELLESDMGAGEQNR